jgi:hypothetical protein
MNEPEEVLEGPRGAVMRLLPKNDETRAAMGDLADEYDEDEWNSATLYSQNGKGVFELYKGAWLRQCPVEDEDELLEFYRAHDTIVSYFRPAQPDPRPVQ